MSRILLVLTLVALPAFAAERSLGRLPNGELYLKDEVDFCLTAGAAQALSPAGQMRRQVAASRLLSLHPSITAVVGQHLSARNWLNGQPLPAALGHTGTDVPAIARSVTAILAPGADAAVVAAELRNHPDVEWTSVIPLHPLADAPNDPLWTNQWGIVRINATNAWDVPQATTGLRVAVIDTGVDLTHPDLSVVYQNGFGGNASGDAQRDARGGSSIDHGTHVAGIIGAIRNNNIGIAGVANVGIMAMGCAVWDGTNSYRVGSAAAAMNDAVANGAAVVNCSFGMAAPLNTGVSNALNNAQAQGVLVVCAAGNDGTNILNSPSAGWAGHSWPIIVSNLTETNALNTGSNFGNEIQLAAPGTSILSTYTTNYTAAAAGGTYGYMTGTSQAAPHVAGAAAMVRSMNPNRIEAFGTVDLLRRMARDLGTAGRDAQFGYGLVQTPASYLSPLKQANTFAGEHPFLWAPNGTYIYPFPRLTDAIAATPPGGTIVLNGGLTGRNVSFSAQLLNANVTLTAFPDRPVTIAP